MKQRLLALFLFGSVFLTAQTLPDVNIPITSRNYFEICQQLDAYFADQYALEDDTDCWDNQMVKYQRWKWWWRDRVQAGATSYYVGMQKFLELRSRAKAKLGPAFDLRAFHDVALGAGPLPLPILDERIAAWIAGGGKGVNR